MKKLTLLITMLILSGIIVNTYADDLTELELMSKQLGSDSTTAGDQEATAGDQEATDGDQENTAGDEETRDGDQENTAGDEETRDGDQENTAGEQENTDKKIVLSTTGDITPNSVSLTFKKLSDYSNYKIYYSKAGDDNLSEKQVNVGDEQEDVNVTINNLDPNTEYQFIAKAFDNNGNPIESTASDPLNVTTKQVHNAPSDNIIHDPVIKTNGKKVTVSYKPGADVAKVQISLSEDGKVFKPLITLDATQTSYTFTSKTTGKKYLKLVPIAKDGTLGICKVGETTVKDNVLLVKIEPKKEAEKQIGKPKTGPEVYLLVLLAILVYIGYSIRKRKI